MYDNIIWYLDQYPESEANHDILQSTLNVLPESTKIIVRTALMVTGNMDGIALQQSDGKYEAEMLALSKYRNTKTIIIGLLGIHSKIANDLNVMFIEKHSSNLHCFYLLKNLEIPMNKDKNISHRDCFDYCARKHHCSDPRLNLLKQLIDVINSQYWSFTHKLIDKRSILMQLKKEIDLLKNGVAHWIYYYYFYRLISCCLAKRSQSEKTRAGKILLKTLMQPRFTPLIVFIHEHCLFRHVVQFDRKVTYEHLELFLQHNIFQSSDAISKLEKESI